jgi:hypothetical protein
MITPEEIQSSGRKRDMGHVANRPWLGRARRKLPAKDKKDQRDAKLMSFQSISQFEFEDRLFKTRLTHAAGKSIVLRDCNCSLGVWLRLETYG